MTFEPERERAELGVREGRSGRKKEREGEKDWEIGRGEFIGDRK